MYHIRQAVIILLACFQLQSHATDETNIRDFIKARIPAFQGQAHNIQFAALIFLSQAEVEDSSLFRFDPQNNDGTPIVDNNYPFRPSRPLNYVVARPHNNRHAENILLDELPNMWNNYRSHYGTPAAIILFTRLYPCTIEPRRRAIQPCTDRIRDVFQEAPYNTVRTRFIGYNNSRDSIRILPTECTRQAGLFDTIGIIINAISFDLCLPESRVRIPRASNEEVVRGDTADRLTSMLDFIPYLQECILRCLGNDNYPGINNDALGRQKAYLINILVDKCLLTEQREVCFRDTFLTKTGNAWSSQQKQTFVDNLIQCHNVCSLKPISQPRQESHDFNNKITCMISADERTDYQTPSAFGCTDVRRTGLLCSYINDQYLTAGNSLCRSDHPCEFHGKRYTWCYTSTSNYWDYCCNDSCGYHGYDYLWCQAGSTWQYCGKGGTTATGYYTNKQSHQCLIEHQCGLHYDYYWHTVNYAYIYYWCYIDVHGNWDYCCIPEPELEDDECTYNGGTRYTLCKNTYHKQYPLNEWVY